MLPFSAPTGPLSVATLVSMLPLFVVEAKQAYKDGLRSHFVSTWNVVAALVLVSLAITIVLAEVPNAASASVAWVF